MLPPLLTICLIYSPAPRSVREWMLELPAGTTVAQALKRSGIFDEFSELDGLQSSGLNIGVWGKRANLTRLLRDHDRIEVYRALRVDPKVARRERFTRQGVKRAGLFSAVRTGGKAGY